MYVSVDRVTHLLAVRVHLECLTERAVPSYSERIVPTAKDGIARAKLEDAVNNTSATTSADSSSGAEVRGRHITDRVIVVDRVSGRRQAERELGHNLGRLGCVETRLLVGETGELALEPWGVLASSSSKLHERNLLRSIVEELDLVLDVEVRAPVGDLSSTAEFANAHDCLAGFVMNVERVLLGTGVGADGRGNRVEGTQGEGRARLCDVRVAGISRWNLAVAKDLGRRGAEALETFVTSAGAHRILTRSTSQVYALSTRYESVSQMTNWGSRCSMAEGMGRVVCANIELSEMVTVSSFFIFPTGTTATGAL